MKEGQKKRLGRRWSLRLVAMILFLIVVFFTGPGLIHRAYRLGTSDAERQARASQYHALAAPELEVLTSGGPLMEARKARREISLWFHARGWPIDEGWHDNFFQKTLRGWRELLAYWQLSSKA